jgi:hypothetical protein
VIDSLSSVEILHIPSYKLKQRLPKATMKTNAQLPSPVPQQDKLRTTLSIRLNPNLSSLKETTRQKGNNSTKTQTFPPEQGNKQGNSSPTTRQTPVPRTKLFHPKQENL